MICDRCEKNIGHEFYNSGGHCSECGDNLCAECARWEDVDGDVICWTCADELRVNYDE